MGEVLASSSGVRYIIADRTCSRDWVSAFLLGMLIPVSEALLETSPFWPSLRFEELPASDVHIGYKVALADLSQVGPSPVARTPVSGT